MTVPDQRRAYHVVDQFETELAAYTGAPYAVAVDSCTNAILLSLVYERLHHNHTTVTLPTRTYIGVLQAVLNAGYQVEWNPRPWHHTYLLPPTRIIDSARHLHPNMYRSQPNHLVCLSFHAAKQLALGRGGAILTDDPDAYQWLRAARMDGRAPGDPGPPVFPGYHCPMPPPIAALGLWILSREPVFASLRPEIYPDLSLWYLAPTTTIETRRTLPPAFHDDVTETARRLWEHPVRTGVATTRDPGKGQP